MSRDEFDWWFDGNPAGSLRSVAVLDGRVVGVAGHSLYRVVLEGEEALASASVHAVTDPVGPRSRHLRRARAKARARGDGAGRRLRARLRERADGAALPRPARLDADREAPRLGAAGVAESAAVDALASSATLMPPRAGRTTSSATTTYLQVAVPRLAARLRGLRRRPDTRSSGRRSGIRGRTISVVADHVGRPELLREARRRAQARLQFALPAPEQRGAYLARRLPAHAADAELHGQGARRAAEHRPARLAHHPRRHGLLLMRRLIFITQQVDPGHPALAATVPKIRALAGLVDEVVVLADRVLPGTLPDNCRSLSFASRTKAGRGMRFEAALTKELPAEAGRDRRPHVPDLRRAGGAARAAARRAAPALVHALEAHADARGCREGVHRRRLASTAARSPSTRRRWSPSATASTSTSSRAVPEGQRANDFRVASLGRYSRAKGLETIVRAVALLDGRAAGGARPCALGGRARRTRRARAPCRRAGPRQAGSPRRRRAALRGARGAATAPTASSTTWRRARPTRSSTRRGRAACP